MAGTVKKKANGDSHRQSRRGTEESPIVKWVLISIALAFCLVFLLLPLVNVFAQAFSMGARAYVAALTNADSWSAIRLTLIVAAITVPLNVVFGVCAAWAIAKFNFRGKSLLITLIDLPFSVSPVVAGLMFVVLFGTNGFFGPWLHDHPLHWFGKVIQIKIIFCEIFPWKIEHELNIIHGYRILSRCRINPKKFIELFIKMNSRGFRPFLLFTTFPK